jgi:hypothetical protein
MAPQLSVIFGPIAKCEPRWMLAEQVEPFSMNGGCAPLLLQPSRSPNVIEHASKHHAPSTRPGTLLSHFMEPCTQGNNDLSEVETHQQWTSMATPFRCWQQQPRASGTPSHAWRVTLPATGTESDTLSTLFE